LKRSRLVAISKSNYWKAGVLGILILIGAIVFWFGFGLVLRTNSPLMPVGSTAMEPNLNYGDLVIIQGVTNANEINAQPLNGDIVVFHKPSEPSTIVIRRAVDKTFNDGAWYIQTQADINGSPDPWESGQNPEDTWGDGFFHQKFMIGEVVGRIPYLGYFPLYISELVRNTVAMFLLVALVFLIILVKYSSLLKKVKALSMLLA
jgi:signal peptidase I